MNEIVLKNLEINLYIYGQLIFDKGSRTTIQWGKKESLFSKYDIFVAL